MSASPISAYGTRVGQVRDAPQHGLAARAVELGEALQRRGVAQAHAGHEQREHAREREREDAREGEEEWCADGWSHPSVRGYSRHLNAE